MSRRKFTETEVLQVIQFELWKIKGVDLGCCRCHEALFEPQLSASGEIVIGAIPIQKIEREHYLEIALGGKDEPANCLYSHAACHKRITNGTKATSAGSSKHRIAKVKRIQAGGKKRKGPPIKSRGFGKSRPFPKKVK